MWNGRYEANLVKFETYFLKCMHYIKMNPVRVKMVDDPQGNRA